MKKFKSLWKFTTAALTMLCVVVCLSNCSGNGEKKSNEKTYSEEEVQNMVNQAVSQAVAEVQNQSKAQGATSQVESTAEVYSESDNTAATSNGRGSVTYKFDWIGSTATLTLNKEEETAQLVFNGKTYYGKCGYDDYTTHDWYVANFPGTDKIDMTYSHNGLFNGECWFWSNRKCIDSKNNYLYIGQTEREVKNPDYRIKLTPVQ